MEKPLAHLEAFLPPGSPDGIYPYFQKYAIHLTLTRSRRSVFGNYRSPARGSNVHHISVNGDLNPYAFLVTLTHEIAHLKAGVDFGRGIKPHGHEWKQTFRQVLQPFVVANIFPTVIAQALNTYLKNPAASSCSDETLYLALRKFDAPKENTGLVAHFPDGSHFKTADGRQFMRIKKLRTRIQCQEIATGKMYLFSAVAEGVFELGTRN